MYWDISAERREVKKRLGFLVLCLFFAGFAGKWRIVFEDLGQHQLCKHSQSGRARRDTPTATRRLMLTGIAVRG